MLIVRATRKLLDRVGGPSLAAGDYSTTVLGQWYATVLFWRPQLVLLVNASTLVPVLMPFAPSGTVCDRIGDEIATVLTVHQVAAPVVADERHRMLEVRLGRTADRRVVGAMTKFGRLAKFARAEDPGRVCRIWPAGWPPRRVVPCSSATSARTVNWPRSFATHRSDV